MDSIHSSPKSVRLENSVNDSPDYESSVECSSVYEEDSQDIASVPSMDTALEVSDNCKHNNCFVNDSDLDEININMNNNSNSFNNYRNNLNLTNSNQIDPKISSLGLQNRCRQTPQTFVNDIKQTNPSDIESQELKRKKSIIYKLYSNSGHKPVITRLSILGRPIPLNRLRNDNRFYREKVAVYNFLQRPQGFIAVGYHIFVSIVVSVCLLLTVFSTISGIFVFVVHLFD